jgi:hypothetical protein
LDAPRRLAAFFDKIIDNKMMRFGAVENCSVVNYFVDLPLSGSVFFGVLNSAKTHGWHSDPTDAGLTVASGFI